jgi:hypothetical protein
VETGFIEGAAVGVTSGSAASTGNLVGINEAPVGTTGDAAATGVAVGVITFPAVGAGPGAIFVSVAEPAVLSAIVGFAEGFAVGFNIAVGF